MEAKMPMRLAKIRNPLFRLAALAVSLACVAASADARQMQPAPPGTAVGAPPFGAKPPGVAQTDDRYGNDRGKEDASVSLRFRTATNKRTGIIVDNLDAASRFCAASPQWVYVIDGMSERLEAVARSMPATGDYAEARAALLDASRKLHDLAIDNAASDLPRVTMRSQGADGIRTTRPLVGVDPARLSSAGVQAAQILTELQTVLLRSGEASEERKSHYSRIAAAVGSNKVLLRSL